MRKLVSSFFENQTQYFKDCKKLALKELWDLKQKRNLLASANSVLHCLQTNRRPSTCYRTIHSAFHITQTPLASDAAANHFQDQRPCMEMNPYSVDPAY